MILLQPHIPVRLEDDLKPHRIVFGTMGWTWLVLGAQDLRKEWGFTYDMVKPDKRLSFRQNRAELVTEITAQVSTGRRPLHPDNIQRNLGLLYLGRYEQGQQGHARSYWEAGWGLEYVNRESGDLNFRFNSTPTLGIGYIKPLGNGNELYAAFRYHHISNAGVKRPNQGQNWVQFMVGYRF